MDSHIRKTQRGTVLVSTLFFSLMAVGVIALALTRATTEATYGEWTSKRTRALYEADALLTRAHAIINASAYDGAHRNLMLWDTSALETIDPYGVPIPATLAFALGAGAFEDSQVEVSRRQALPDATGTYPLLPEGWYRLEVGVQAPDYDVNGTPIVRKRVRQYVRERRSFSKFSIYVSDDNLGIAGFTTNPGQLLEGQIHTNKTLYFYYANRYYPRRVTSVLGKGYAVGATPSNTYLLHPQNDFASPVISLPPVSELLDPSYLPNPDTLYGKAIGSAPSNAPLQTSNPAGAYYVQYQGVSNLAGLKASSSDPDPILVYNTDGGASASSPAGLALEGNVNAEAVLNGTSFDLRIVHSGNPSLYAWVKNIPLPQNGLVFMRTYADARTFRISGSIEKRTTFSTMGTAVIAGSVVYRDAEGDPATLYGADPSQTYAPNERPSGASYDPTDGYYDGNASFGLVAKNDVLWGMSMPANAEVCGALLSVEKRVTIEGTTYNSSGGVTGFNGLFLKNSLRRFGGIVCKRRPATAIVSGSSGALLSGYASGSSLYDELLASTPPPFFPADDRPLYLGWEVVR